MSQGRGNLELMVKKVEEVVSKDYLTIGSEEKIATVIKKMAKRATVKHIVSVLQVIFGQMQASGHCR